jgi:hypothetical protein
VNTSAVQLASDAWIDIFPTKKSQSFGKNAKIQAVNLDKDVVRLH